MFKYYNFIRDIWISLFNVISVLVLNIVYIHARLIKRYRGEGVIHILGTGPSLRNDLERLKCNLKENDSLLCVNGFALSPLFKELRPSLYMLSDGGFFMDAISSTTSSKFVIDVFEAIQNVEWPLTLFVPYNKRKSKRVKEIRNKNIRVKPILNIPIYGGIRNFNAFLFYMGLANPVYQNVLNSALFYSIKSGYTKIFLWGADHNWLESRTVLEDNCMYQRDPHFNDTHEVELKKADIISVASEMEDLVRCFRAYEELKVYSDWKGAQVFNLSSKSWIDTFPRKVDI